jgi:predicted dehydrogenase
MAVNFGIIGCGQMVLGAHLPNLNTIPEAEVVALCSRSEASRLRARELCRNDAVALYQDPLEVIRDPKVEAVLIAVPNYLHATLATTALEAGKAVFLEKPLATNLADARALVQKVRATGGILQVGYELSYARLIRHAKQLVTDGRLGDLTMLGMTEIRGPMRPGWRQRKDWTGGVMLEKNSHYLHLFNEFAASEPAQVYGAGGRAVNRSSELLDHCLVTIQYASGVTATLSMCLLDPYHQRYDFEVIGTRGRMLIDEWREQIHYWSFTENVHQVMEVCPEPGQIDAKHPGTRAELVAFIASVRAGTPPAVDALKAARTTALALAIETAIERGTPQPVPGLDFHNGPQAMEEQR